MPFVNNKWSRNIFEELIKTSAHRAVSLQRPWYSHSLCNSNEGTRQVTSFTTALTFLHYHGLACDYYRNPHHLWKEFFDKIGNLLSFQAHMDMNTPNWGFKPLRTGWQQDSLANLHLDPCVYASGYWHQLHSHVITYSLISDKIHSFLVHSRDNG